MAGHAAAFASHLHFFSGHNMDLYKRLIKVLMRLILSTDEAALRTIVDF